MTHQTKLQIVLFLNNFSLDNSKPNILQEKWD